MPIYHRAFDIIDAFTSEFLKKSAGEIFFSREVVNTALVVYTLSHYQLGNLGSIRVRKISEHSTEISYTNPHIPEYGDNFHYSPQFDSWVREKHPDFITSNTVGKVNDPDFAKRLFGLYQEWLFLERREFFHRLIREHDANIHLEQANENATETKTEHKELVSVQQLDEPSVKLSIGTIGNGNQLKPWELIPEHNYDREAVEMWHKGYTNAEIGEKLHISPRRITNRLSELRINFGTEIVPTNETRRKKAIFDNMRDIK